MAQPPGKFVYALPAASIAMGIFIFSMQFWADFEPPKLQHLIKASGKIELVEFKGEIAGVRFRLVGNEPDFFASTAGSNFNLSIALNYSMGHTEQVLIKFEEGTHRVYEIETEKKFILSYPRASDSLKSNDRFGLYAGGLTMIALGIYIAYTIRRSRART